MNEEEPLHNKNEPVVPDKHSLPYPVRSLDPPISLVDRAREIETAQTSIQSHVSGKLDLIAGQIKALQEEARKILEQAEVDVELHRVKCNFEKRPGQEMHLYEKNGRETYFSLLSPREWGGKPPHRHLGSYRLRADQSFERLD